VDWWGDAEVWGLLRGLREVLLILLWRWWVIGMFRLLYYLWLLSFKATNLISISMLYNMLWECNFFHNRIWVYKTLISTIARISNWLYIIIDTSTSMLDIYLFLKSIIYFNLHCWVVLDLVPCLKTVDWEGSELLSWLICYWGEVRNLITISYIIFLISVLRRLWNW
jgi:hypothetical protein